MRVVELGHVVLWVQDLARSRRFYGEVLGWPELGEVRPGRVAYTTGRTHHELYLIEIGAAAAPVAPAPRLGLYHIGVKIGTTDAELDEARATLDACGVPVAGESGGDVTHSLYVLDPDGNEVELYIDVQPELWRQRLPESLRSRSTIGASRG